MSGEASRRGRGFEIGRKLGLGARTESVSLEEMGALGGVRLRLNKRLSADRAQAELGRTPKRPGVVAPSSRSAPTPRPRRHRP